MIQRGNNRQTIFFAAEHYARYGDWLAEAASRAGCAIHAYALMTNNVHLLATTGLADSLPRMMQLLGRYFNAAYRRSRTLWEGRYRAAPIDSEAYFLACCRYVELNPVRGEIVGRPRGYTWSSYRAHTLGDTRFKQAIAEALGRRVAPLPVGRKPKPRDDERQISLL